jgi:hypothetical protein
MRRAERDLAAAKNRPQLGVGSQAELRSLAAAGVLAERDAQRKLDEARAAARVTLEEMARRSRDRAAIGNIVIPKTAPGGVAVARSTASSSSGFACWARRSR